MNAKIKLVLAVVLALCFLGLSIGALEVVPKYIEDRYYVMGVEGKWSNLVSFCSMLWLQCVAFMVG